MGYLKVSRELLNSSFWRSLAPAEKGILIDLMAMAAYKPTSFNLYGTEIELEKYELCFSVLKIANKYRVTEYAIRSLIKKLENAKILTKTIRKITNAVSNEISRGNSRCEYIKKTTCCYTSVTFYGWAFYADDQCDSNNDSNDESHEGCQTEAQTANHEHNQLSINQEEKEKNSACAVPSFEIPKDLPYKKTWYSMDEIAELNFAYADEILADWKLYSGRSEKEVREKLKVFTKKKLRLGLTKMTMDIFDQEFRKEIKTASAQNSKHKNEPVQKLKYLGREK